MSTKTIPPTLVPDRESEGDRQPSGPRSAVHSAAGRPGRKIAGSASAVTHGIPSTRAASAEPAFTSGLKPSV